MLLKLLQKIFKKIYMYSGNTKFLFRLLLSKSMSVYIRVIKVNSGYNKPHWTLKMFATTEACSKGTVY